jgi:hypothetical protein
MDEELEHGSFAFPTSPNQTIDELKAAGFLPELTTGGTSLRLFLSETKNFRRLMGLASSVRLTDLDESRAFLTRLDSRERAHVERVVSQILADLPAYMDSEAERLLVESDLESNTGDSTKYYPMADELMAVTTGVVFASSFSKLVAERLRVFESDSEKRQYAHTLLDVGPPVRLSTTLGKALLAVILGAFEQYLSGLLRTEALASDVELFGDSPPVPRDVVRRYQGNIDTKDLDRWQ